MIRSKGIWPERCKRTPTWLRTSRGLSPVYELKGQLAVGTLQPDFIGPNDLGEPLATRLFLADDDPLVDNLSRPWVTHPFQGHLKPKLTSQLDFDVTDMAGAVDPPRNRGDKNCRYHGEHTEHQRGHGLAKRAIQGKHPCLPDGWRSKRTMALEWSGSIRPSRIDEMAISLN